MAREDGVQGAGTGYGQIAPSDRHASYRQPSPTRGELRQLLDFMTLTRLPQDGRRGGTRGGTRPRMGRNMSSPSRLGSGSGRRG